MLAVFTPDRIRHLTLALLGAAVWVSSAPLAAARRITITVRVYQTAGLPSAIEEKALAETEALLQSAMVDVRWRRCTGPANERYTTCDALPGPSELTLRILGEKAVNQETPGALDAPEIGDPNAASPVLILVRWADAASSGAELLALLARGVEQLVIRQNQMGPIRDEEPSRGVDTALVQAIELGEKVLRLQDHPVADYAGNAGMQNPGGNLPQDELGVADDYSMPGIRPTLVAHHQVGALCQHIHQLAFPFVTPLGSNDHHAGGPGIEHVGSAAETTKEPPSARSGQALAGLLRPRANLSVGRSKVNLRDCPPHSLRHIQRQSIGGVRRGMNATKRVPGEPADGHGGTPGPAQGSAVDENTQR